jgi:LmbE family N-acetylglucosaminyl deacetylase
VTDRERKCVLAVGAHPDDVEFLMAGTLIRLKGLGFEVHVATMTDGDMGSAELAREEIGRIRLVEAENAAKKIGATYHYLGFHDFALYFNDETRRAAARLLREVNPSIVLTNSPQDYMPDHEITGEVIRDACFSAPVPNWETPGAGPIASVPHLYYADAIEGKDIFGTPIPAGLYIDISSVIDEKAEMLKCHASQREWLMKHHKIDQYIESMKAWSRKRGEEAGLEYAEAFRQHLGHGYPQDNVLGGLFV